MGLGLTLTLTLNAQSQIAQTLIIVLCARDGQWAGSALAQSTPMMHMPMALARTISLSASVSRYECHLVPADHLAADQRGIVIGLGVADTSNIAM